jgi:DegV family protein with EDD domain
LGKDGIMVKIISDSTCDLSKELVERYDISILPLHILLGDEEYEDGVDIMPDEIYRWSDEHKLTPKTSAPSIERAKELMTPFLKQGMELVCFAISEDMSTSANIMRLAAEELDAEDKVFVIDSMNLSTGIGHLVIEAAVMAKQGTNGREITEQIEELRPYVRASFVVDTLTYLYRGGRCSGLSAMVGGALKLHPMIVVRDGKMSATRKYRGNISRVIMNYAKDLENDMRNAKTDRVFITHSGCDRDTVLQVRNYLEELNIFDEILETRAGGVVSSHCGPGTLGVLFIQKK